MSVVAYNTPNLCMFAMYLIQTAHQKRQELATVRFLPRASWCGILIRRWRDKVGRPQEVCASSEKVSAPPIFLFVLFLAPVFTGRMLVSRSIHVGVVSCL